MRTYLIRPGFSFLGDAGQCLTGGDSIELEDDIAARHAEKLDLAPAADVTAAPALIVPALVAGALAVSAMASRDMG